MPKEKIIKKEFVVTGANPNCTQCPLHKTSCADDKKLVCLWGSGNKQASIVLVGEASSKDDILKETPFIGEAGQLLNKYLKVVGINRENIYITNTVKCHPENSRVPKPAEIKHCSPYLDFELAEIKPKVIGMLGAIAFERILGLEGITKYRGRPMWSEKYHCWCVPTWHPSYIKRNGESLEEVEQFKRDLSLMKKIAETGETGQLKTKYDVIDNIELFDAMMQCIKSYKVASLDTETYGDYLTGKIITIQFSIKAGTAFVVPFYKTGSQYTEPTDKIWTDEQEQHIWSTLKAYLEDTERKKIGQNIKYEYQFLKLYGITLKGVCFDTMLGHYLLDENKKGTHDLGTMALNYTDMGDYSNELYQLIGWDDIKDDQKKFKMIEAPFEAICKYACKDADATFRLFCVFFPKIKSQGLLPLLTQLMIPLSYALGDMEVTGVKVDLEYYAKLAKKYEQKIKEIDDELRSYPDVAFLERKQGAPVNFNSTKQLKVLFYELLKLPIYKYVHNKKKKNQDEKNPSTDAEVLEQLAEEHPIPKLIWKHRTYQKFLSTYVAPMPEYVWSDGRIHTSYWQHVTVTGRLASSDPNLQNIPKKEPEMAKEVRYGLIAKEGHTFVAVDKGQIEFRLLANECKDSVMLADIASGLDIHKTIASIGFRIPYDQVTPELREKAKTIVYCVPLDTKILTQSGWKSYNEVKIGDYTIGYNPSTKQTEWTKITKLHFFPKASIIELKNSTFNFRCTPEHRWLNLRRTSGECIIPNKKYRRILKEEFVFTKDINQEDNLILSAKFNSTGCLDLSNDEVALISWMLTDGDKHCVYQSEKKYSNEIKELFTRLFGNFTICKNTNGSGNVFLVPAKQARFIFNKAGLNFDSNKKDPSLEQFILKLSSEQRTTFLNTAMQAEGTKNIFYQNPGPVLDAIKLTAYLEGFLVRQHDAYKWNKWSKKYCQGLVLSKPKVTGQELSKNHISEEPVWCVTTELGTMTVKQGNLVVLTGNSIVYGKSADNLAKETGLSVDQVNAIFGAIFSRYIKINDWMDITFNKAKTTGEVTNWVGRRRRLYSHFKRANESENMRQKMVLLAEARRLAINSPIQSGAHDIVTIDTLRVRHELLKQKLESKLIMTTHDELIVEAKNEELNAVIKLMYTNMTKSPSAKITVPLTVDVSIGTRLGDMKKLKTFTVV